MRIEFRPEAAGIYNDSADCLEFWYELGCLDAPDYIPSGSTVKPASFLSGGKLSKDRLVGNVVFRTEDDVFELL
jgi:hypothetical protein